MASSALTSLITSEAAVSALGTDSKAFRMQVASMAQGDAIFREEYMKGNVVSFRDTY